MDVSREDRIELPEERNKARQLVDLYGAEILQEPPGSFADVPEGKALVWVVINNEPLPELAYYVHNEVMFGQMVREVTRGQEMHEPEPGVVSLVPENPRPTTWLLLDKDIADRLCPAAARFRRSFEADLAAEVDLASHPDNMLPVARVGRMKLKQDAKVLRRYAAELAGELDSDDAPPRPLLEAAGDRRVASTDLREIARMLESWAERDWIAVIELSADRQYLDGPLPPLPGAES
jgi:hypothetical protein